MQSWPIEQKMDHALDVIDTYYQRLEGCVYVAFSGGLDSTVLTYLVDFYTDLCGLPSVPLVFNDTTNEYREILTFVRSFGDRVTWIRPKMTFAQSLIKYGYPLVSKEQAHYIEQVRTTKSEKLRQLRLQGKQCVSKKTGKKYTAYKIAEKWKYLLDSDIKITSKCCDILKKNPVSKYEKRTGRSPLVGSRADESSMRTLQYRIAGCNLFSAKRNVSRPLSIFSREDIWQIIRKYGIRYCRIYDDQLINGRIVKGEQRTGCAYCALGVQYEDPSDTRFHRLEQREPKRFRSFMEKLGYKKALRLIGVQLGTEEVTCKKGQKGLKGFKKGQKVSNGK